MAPDRGAVSSVNGRRVITVDSGAEIRTVDHCFMPNGSIQAFDNVVPIRSDNVAHVEASHQINGKATCTQNTIVLSSQIHPRAVAGIRSGTIGGPCHFLKNPHDFYINGSSVLLDGDLVQANTHNTEPGFVVHPGRYTPLEGSEIEYLPLGSVSDFAYQEVGTHQIQLKLSYPNGQPVLLQSCLVQLETLQQNAQSKTRITGTALTQGEGLIFITQEEFESAELIFDKIESIVYFTENKKQGYPTHCQRFKIKQLPKIADTCVALTIRVLPPLLIKNGLTIGPHTPLSPRELEQIKMQGNEITICLHDHDEIGGPGVYLKTLQFEENLSACRLSSWTFKASHYKKTVGLDQKNPEIAYQNMIAEFPNFKKDFQRFCKGFLPGLQSALEAFFEFENPAAKANPVFTRQLGTGFYQKIIQTEYDLNRKMGFDGSDWAQYKRMIGIHYNTDCKEALGLITKQLQKQNIRIKLLRA